jgi:hypothetical protein
MKSLSVRLGVILIGLAIFGCAKAEEGDSGNISFDFTVMKIIFVFVGVTSTMMSIVLACVRFDLEQRMPTLFFYATSVASLIFWALLTGLVKL